MFERVKWEGKAPNCMVMRYYYNLTVLFKYKLYINLDLFTNNKIELYNCYVVGDINFVWQC
jgi:hypothetical protein